MLWGTIFAVCLASTTFAQRVISGQRKGNSQCGSGICQLIWDCPPVLELLKEAKQNRNHHSYLKSLMCGFENDQPKVCCPVTNTVEEGGGDNILPSEPNCGVSGNIDTERIEGGSPSELGQWPWMAALGYRNKRGDSPKITWLCGGSLITQNHVLTAAHCLTHGKYVLYKIRLGDLDLNDQINDGATPVERFIEQIIPHERYSKLSNDIALLKFDRPVTFTHLIQPICLPKTPELRSDRFERKTPFTAGWGNLYYRGPSSTHLQHVQFPVVNNGICANIFKRYNAQITRSQICAGVLTGGKDACLGDSGGPLMAPKGLHFYLIGIVSFGYQCGKVGYPGVYTRTTEYIDWISSKVRA